MSSQMSDDDEALEEFFRNLVPSLYSGIDRTMKLFSIVILYKDPTMRRARILKSATDLSTFGFFYKRNAAEFMLFTAKVITERFSAPSRNSIKENEYLIHCCIRRDNLTGVCITDQEYQSKSAFTLLDKVLSDFAEHIKSNDWIRIADEKDCKYDNLAKFLTIWQNPKQADPLTKVKDEVEETKVVLHNTVQSILERGEKLDDLVKASEGLSAQTKMFYTQAKKMNGCCNLT